MIEMLGTYLSFPLVQYALIVGVLIALCSSLLGVTLVLKRFSFIGDGLSHVAFGAMAVAGVLHMTNDMLLVLPVTVVSAGCGLSAAQHVFRVRQPVRRRLYHPVRFHVHPDADGGGSMAVHRTFHRGGHYLYPVLQQDFRGDIR